MLVCFPPGADSRGGKGPEKVEGWILPDLVSVAQRGRGLTASLGEQVTGWAVEHKLGKEEGETLG